MNIAVIFVLLAALQSVPDGTVPEHPGTQAPQTHAYKSVDGRELLADVYRPDVAGPVPVVVWLHGGALIFGDRSWVREEFLDFSRREGLAVVSLDYRLAPEAKLPEIVGDVLDGIRWVREHGPGLFDADPTRIVVAGNSAGGYLALLSGARADPKVAAVVSYWGYGAVDGDWYSTPHYLDGDLAPLGPEHLRRADGSLNRELYYIYLRQQGTWTREVTGMDPATQGLEISRFNPLDLLGGDFPPTMLVHGREDRDVPASESRIFAEVLGRHGVEHELVLVPDAGHELEEGDPSDVASAHLRAERFIRRIFAGSRAPGAG